MKRYQIGRDDENEIVIRHPSVSRVHALLDDLGDGQLLLTDLDSTYGTGVERNGNWIQVQKAVVARDERVRFGDEVRGVAALIQSADRTDRTLPRPAATTLLMPVQRSRRSIGIAAGFGALLAVAGMAVWFGFGAAHSSTRQAYVAECVAQGYKPTACECHANVLHTRLNDSEFRLYTTHLRDRSAPPAQIIRKVLPVFTSLDACNKR